MLRLNHWLTFEFHCSVYVCTTRNKVKIWSLCLTEHFLWKWKVKIFLTMIVEDCPKFILITQLVVLPKREARFGAKEWLSDTWHNNCFSMWLGAGLPCCSAGMTGDCWLGIAEAPIRDCSLGSSAGHCWLGISCVPEVSFLVWRQIQPILVPLFLLIGTQRL